MIDWTKPIETTDGQAARWLGEMRKRGGHGNVVAVTEADGYEVLLYVNDKGAASTGCPPSVRNVPEKHERWFNFDGDELGGIYPSKEGADIWASERRTACIRVEWQDGEGLT